MRERAGEELPAVEPRALPRAAVLRAQIIDRLIALNEEQLLLVEAQLDRLRF